MRFEKVSFEQYERSCKGDKYYSKIAVFSADELSGRGSVRFDDRFKVLQSCSTREIYDMISLPKRATRYSAGYDIYAPYDFTLAPGETIKIATGIRILLDNNKFLMCVPRSGHGFKARVQLDNTIGIIDADYSYSKNEGHIHAKFTNDSNTGEYITVKQGEAMMQAIILPYFTIDNEIAPTRTRDGGLGSTTN